MTAACGHLAEEEPNTGLPGTYELMRRRDAVWNFVWSLCASSTCSPL